jgi:metal-sulfur cluster biosynthetic enzyme
MSMTPIQPEQVKEMLRQVNFPGRSRDLVALGFVKSIAVQGSAIEVELTPDSINVEKVTVMERDVETLLRGVGFEQIEIHTEPPYDDDSMLLGGAAMNPLQVDMKEYGLEPIPDPSHGGAPHLKDLLAAGEPQKQKHEPPTEPPANAPDAFDPNMVSDGPQGNSDPSYDGPVPVFQWQVKPDETPDTPQKVKFSIDSWNYVVLWLTHAPQDLVYASVHARHWIRYEGKARPNPAGRPEGVNLVYDSRREGIVAIYGTVTDFRPFVEAFHLAYTGQHVAAEHASEEPAGTV